LEPSPAWSSPNRDPQRGAQTARRKTGLHRRHTPERTVRKPQSLDGHRPTGGLAPALLVLLVRCGADRLVLFLQRAMTDWMQAWSRCTDHVPPTAHPQRAAAAPFPWICGHRSPRCWLASFSVLNTRQHHDRNRSRKNKCQPFEAERRSVYQASLHRAKARSDNIIFPSVL
jgi:hypothetical protein